MSKGDDTRVEILDVALAQASERGFESLTIGSLAERVGISKSGLFAHFGSREELQIAAIEAAARALPRPCSSPRSRPSVGSRVCGRCSTTGSIGRRAAD